MRVAFVARAEVPKGSIAAWRAFVQDCGRRLGVGPGDVAVLLCQDEEIAELNHRFLAKDRPTDVLSFPDHSRGPGGRVHIGDIAISIDSAGLQAEAAGHGLDVEVRRLLIHGLLHLLGYDHERDEGQMEALEGDLRRALLPDAV